MSRDKAKKLLTPLPLEILLLIMQFLDLPDLRAMTMTCSYFGTALDPMLYKHAIAIGAHREKFVYAAVWGRATVISKFLEAGVSMIEFEGRTLTYYPRDRTSEERRAARTEKLHPLFAATVFGHLEVVRALITEGNVDVDFEQNRKTTALIGAIAYCCLDVVELLAKYGARLIAESDASDEDDVNYVNYLDVDDYLHSPFLYATVSGNKDALEIMYIELQTRSIPKKTMLNLLQRACFLACYQDFTDIVQFFLLEGVSASSRVKKSGCRLLYYASRRGNLPMIKLLVRYGAKMEDERDTGVVSVFRDWKPSIAKGIVKLFLNSGCNVANGHRHACALWFVAQGCERLMGRDDELVKLLKINGFNEKHCRDNCWIKGRYRFEAPDLLSETLYDYVKGKQPDV